MCEKVSYIALFHTFYRFSSNFADPVGLEPLLRIDSAEC